MVAGEIQTTIILKKNIDFIIQTQGQWKTKFIRNKHICRLDVIVELEKSSFSFFIFRRFANILNGIN